MLQIFMEFDMEMCYNIYEEAMPGRKEVKFENN